MKKHLIIVTMVSFVVLAALQGLGNASFIPMNIGDFVTLNSSFTNEFGRKPADVISNIPFDIPDGDADFFAFNNNTVNPLVLTANIKGPTTAYLLINTNWGKNDLSGRVVFNTLGQQSFTLDLIGGVNIRDWNQSGYTNTVTDPRSSQIDFTAYPDMWSSQGRIDLLTVQLPQAFYADTLKSITFLDFGKDGSISEYIDGASRIRVEGVTIEATPIPEPSSFWLFAIGLGLLGYLIRKRSIFVKASSF
jgi:hypothetical protein